MRLLVHLHLFYREQLDYFLDKLSDIQKEYDVHLYLTHIDKLSDREERKIYSKFPNSKLIELENIGYDLYPFVEVVKSVDLDSYNVVLKLHTKNTHAHDCYTFNENYTTKHISWAEGLLTPLIDNVTLFKKNISALEQPNVNMIGSGLFINQKNVANKIIIEHLKKLLSKLEISLPSSYPHISGTIFICRPDMLKPLKKFSKSDFTKPTGEPDSAHAMEILLGILATQNNNKIASCDFDYKPFLASKPLLFFRTFFNLIWIKIAKLLGIIKEEKFNNRLEKAKFRIRYILNLH